MKICTVTDRIPLASIIGKLGTQAVNHGPLMRIVVTNNLELWPVIHGK